MKLAASYLRNPIIDLNMHPPPKRILPAIAVLLTVGTASGKDVQCVSGTHTLQVKIFGDGHVRPNKPVALDVVVENIGQSKLKLPMPMEPYWYWLRLEARNEQGQVIDWRGPELKLIYSERDRISIMPGYSYGRSFKNLENDFDFSKPGKYSIRAIWGIDPDGKCKWGRYTSREFILHVAP